MIKKIKTKIVTIKAIAIIAIKMIKIVSKEIKVNLITDSSGFALIMTLWVLAIISVLLLTFSMSVNLSIKNASFLKDNIEGEGLTIAAVNRLKTAIVYPKDRNKAEKSDNDKKDDSSANSNSSESSNSSSNNSRNKSSSNNTSNNNSSSNSSSKNSSSSSDSGSEKKEDPKTKEENKKRAEWYYKILGKWYIYTDDWRATREKELNTDPSQYILCEITAEDGKFDLKKINDVESLVGYPESILQNIKDKLKEDKKFTFTCVPQLLMINGVSGENYDGDGRDIKGLKNVLTTFSDGKVYINNTGSTALAFIPGMDPGAAQTIADNDQLISNFDELKQLIGTVDENTKKKMEKWLKFIPEYFKIRAYRNVSGVDEVTEAVISIKNGQIELLSLK